MQGSCGRCVIDNTSVIVSHGTGPDAVMAPEMEMFGRIYGFTFMAHRLKHADRKARVERPFYYVETNFLVGRTFTDWHDLNLQAVKWCDEVANRKPKKSLGMSPTEAYVMEKPSLIPLPRVTPPVYVAKQRTNEEKCLVGTSDTLDRYVVELKKRSRGRGLVRFRRLLDLKRSYPEKPFSQAIEDALHYGLFDLARLERMILNNTGGNFFNLSSFPFENQPAVDRTQIMTLAGLDFMQRGENIIFTGSTGTGKSGLASGILRQAIVAGYRGRFYNVQDLLDELYASLADHITIRLLRKLCRFDLLILDELCKALYNSSYDKLNVM